MGLYTLIFGFAIGADNAAHAVGFACGAALGLACKPSWLRARRFGPLNLVEALLGAGAALATVYLALFPPGS